MRVRLSREARQDVRDLAAYIRAESPTAAAKVLQEIDRALERLADFPDLGHRRTDLTHRPVRFWQVVSYYIVYLEDVSPIQVLRIVHTSRDIPEIL